MFIFTRNSKSMIAATDGFFVSGEKIDEVLLSEKLEKNAKNVGLEKVSSSDFFYENMNKVYLGEDRQIEVNTNYPIYTNDGLAITNISDDVKIINDHFEFFDGYKNFTLTGGNLYNYKDLEQADLEDYILLQLPNFVYVNLSELTIKTNTKEHKIPINSIIGFYEEYIKYYYYDKKGKLIYDFIPGVDLGNSVSFSSDESCSYEQLLVAIGKIEDSSEKVQEEEPPKEDYVIEISSNNGNEHISTEKKYQKPKVSLNSFTTNVYSTKSRLSISDPSGTIIGGINVQFKIGDKIFLRKVFVDSGSIEITGLMPDAEFTVLGTYRYYDENKKKMEVTFFEEKIKTLGVETLEPIELSFRNGDIYSNKIELADFKIVSDLKSEALKGIAKGIITVDEDEFGINASILQKLVNGKSLVYNSPTKLTSDSNYDYVIRIYDGYGNEIKTINNSGSTRTSMEAPTSTVKVIESKVNLTSLQVNTKNLNNVPINNYHYVVYDKNMATVFKGKLDNSLSTEDVVLDGLDPNSVYYLKIYGDYDTRDGKGVLKDNLMGDISFTTMPLSSIGYFRLISLAEDLTNNSVKLKSNLDLDNTSSVLVDLLYAFDIKITDPEDHVVYSKSYTGDDLIPIKNGQDFIESISDLTSVTEYTVSFSAKVKQGNVVENISVISSLDVFKTKKNHAYVNIVNKFVTGSMIDFDVNVVDEDGAIESGRVILEVRDGNSKLVYVKNLSVNGEYERIILDKLNKESYYYFNYKVEEYNIGFDNSTFESDYLLFSENIYTKEGISGSIEIDSILRQIDGKNLFNIEDYDRIRKEGNIGFKEYDLKNNTITFGAKNGYTNYSYYLPEAKGLNITVSFKARYNKKTPNKAPAYIGRGYGQNLNYPLTGLNDTYQQYTFSFNSTSDYVGFVVNETSSKNLKTLVDFKDIMIYDNNYTKDVSLSISSTGYRFSNPMMFSGSDLMPSKNSGSTIGNTGNGFARITDKASGKVYTYDYTGDYQIFKVNTTSTYSIELWGAQGGSSIENGGVYEINKDNCINGHCYGGKGSYTSGDIKLVSGTKLYVYVGGKGTDAEVRKDAPGGFNGGGYGSWDHSDDEAAGGGGGATDVRLVGGNWDNMDSLKSRIMVAAGGGGGTDIYPGGSGGALSSVATDYAKGANQTSGNAFGVGGNGVYTYSNKPVAGGGGGWYGGIAPTKTNAYNLQASGGSSYISGYVGCIFYEKNIVVDSNYQPYSESDDYKATIRINLYDRNDEITNGKYYVRVFLDGDNIQNHEYDFYGDSLENVLKYFEFKKNKSYELRLSVLIRGRFYDISSLNFNTNSEIRTIKTVSEFYAMHTNGKYIVANDLDFSGNNTYYSSYFYGEIDFQGHKLIYHAKRSNSYIFHSLMSSAVLSNVVIEAHLDNPSAKSYFRGITYRNFGRIDNFQLNIVESTAVANYYYSPVVAYNYGTVSNFVIHSAVSMYAICGSGLIGYHNEGTIKNGYVYGENVKSYYETGPLRSYKDLGVLVGSTGVNSRIENVFSLISVETDNSIVADSYVGNLVGVASSLRIKNAYSVEDSTKTITNLSSRDPNLGRFGSANASNLYYVSDTTYSTNYSRKLSKLALWNSDFQNKLFNSEDNIFEVKDYVSLGYYPQLIMNDCMPNQEWIPLPSVDNKDLIDVTYTEELVNKGNSATVKLEINNPSAEKITKIDIKNIRTVKILSQSDMYGTSTVEIEIENPLIYKSGAYSIMVVEATTEFNLKYETTYEEKERLLDVDLYQPIYSLADFKNINTSRETNYILMNDLDFMTVSSPASYVVSGTFKGKFNGNGHTIKNVNLTSSNGLFYVVTSGTIKNLFIDNYKKTNLSGYNSIIYQITGNSLLDNVHATNVNIAASSYTSGLVGYVDNSTITNCSVTNFKNITETSNQDIRIGGMINYINNSTVQNCYVQGVDIQNKASDSTAGIGGLIGYANSGIIENVYATGSVVSNSGNIGGIVGYSGAKINNAMSNVDVYSELDYVGGIVGKRGTDNITSTLVTGDVYSSYTGIYIHRTFGNPVDSFQDNYVWDNQLFYGYISGDTSSEALLSEDELFRRDTYYDLLSFGDHFVYDDLSKKALPKLKNSDTGKLLPNQKDIKLEVEQFDVTNMYFESSISSAEIHIEIDNPSNLEVKKISFDYLEIQRIKNISTSNGLTIINVDVTPTRYIDSYLLNQITYVANGKEVQYYKQTKVMDTEKQDILSFYKDLSSYEDWQKISKDYAENYRLVGNIDFTGKANINTGVKIARLEGQTTSSEDLYTISGMNVTAKKAGFGIINLLTTSLKNVVFDNITITSTVSSGDYTNIIKFNYGDIENVKFNNITITSRTSYAAPMGWYRGIDMRTVSVYNNTISGASFVGGLMARSYNYDTFDISGSYCNVTGTSQYVGGLIGYKDYSNPATNFNYTVDHMTVKGVNDVGGMFGYGGANYSTVTNSHVEGTGTGQYIGGVSGRAGQYYMVSVEVRDTEVIANNHNYVGGMFGWSYDLNTAYASNVTVVQNGASKSYVGGIIGYKNGYTHQNMGIVDSRITSNGQYVGGIVGSLWGTLQYCYANNVEVTGTNSVGGVAGYGANGTAVYVTSNAKVTATNAYAGGVIGYIAYSDPLESSLTIKLRYIMVENSDIVASNYVGGITGYTAHLLSDSYVYGIFVAANVKSTGSSTYVGAVSSFDTILEGEMPRIYLYEGNKINDKQVTDEISHYLDINSSNLFSADTIATQAFYTSRSFATSRYDFSTLASGYYPKLKSSSSVNLLYQKDLTLPVSVVSYSFRKSVNLTGHLLPTLDVYSSGISTVNLEFSDLDEYSFFTVYDSNGKEVAVHDIDKRVFSLTYDYQSDFKVVVSDGLNKEVYQIKPENVANHVTTYDDFYAYIYEGKLKGSIIGTTDTYIHIYENLALTEDLKVFDMSKGELISEDNSFDLSLLSNSVPLFSMIYGKTSIDTYYNYSVIHQKDNDVFFDKQIFVKNGEMEIIDSSLDNKKNSIIIDSYSKDHYVTVLGNDGVIYDLKAKIKLPDEFTNMDVEEMSNNIHSKSSYIVVRYKSGKIVVFDYLTRKKVTSEKAVDEISLFDYFSKNLAYRRSLIDSDYMEDYNNSLDLIELLEDKPIVSTKDGFVVSDSVEISKEDKKKTTNYVSYYNATKKNYDIIDTSSLVDKTNHDEVISEVDKIYTSNDLVQTYMNRSIGVKVHNHINAILVFGLLLFAILLAIFMGFRNTKLLRMSEE